MSLDENSSKKSRLFERMMLTEDALVDRGYSKTGYRKFELTQDGPAAPLPQDEAPLIYTGHAQCRLPQRNLTPWQVEYVIMHGTVFHCAGAVIVHLRRKDVQAFDGDPLKAERLIGTTVVLDPTQLHVLTVYRNRQEGMRRLKRKPRESRPWLAQYSRDVL